MRMDTGLEESRKSVREFFGVDKLERRPIPIPCHTFNTLLHIYSLLPDQRNNPFAQYTTTTTAADGVYENYEPRRKNAASYACDHPFGVEVGDSSFHNGRISDTTVSLCDDDVLRGPESIADEFGILKNSEMIDKSEYAKAGTNDDICNVHKDLSSIERILMDESDDLDMLQLPNKDVNVDHACGFDSIMDIDRPCDKSVTMESFQSEKCITGEITVKDVVLGKDREGVEVNRSILEGGKKAAEQIVLRELSETNRLTSTGQERENVGEGSLGKLFENVGKMNQLIVSAKAKKTMVKNTTKMTDKGVKSGLGRLVLVEDEAYSKMTSRGDDPLIQGEIQKQDASIIWRSPSSKEDNERRPKACERLRYNREQLLHIGKTAFVPEYIKNVARDIGAEIQEKHQTAAAFAVADSVILKNKRGGSGSEARKEKKKLRKRKRRAELNRELGVKRPKIKHAAKPKVVEHCRHYRDGRCHEGERCKFSHDVVPLTKSKACCHFARQSCMKGDACEFDHQLSKYPCNNYVEKGFCNRGEICLFSHKIAVKEGIEPSTMALTPGGHSVGQQDVSKSKQQHKDNATVPFIPGKATSKNSEVFTTKTIPPTRKPKGLAFISIGKSQLANPLLPKESSMSQQSCYTAGASVQPNVVEGTTINLRNLLDRTSVDKLGSNKPLNQPPKRDNSTRNISFKMPLLNDSAIQHLKDTSGRTDYAVGTPTQYGAPDVSPLIKGTPTLDKAPNLSEMFTGGPTRAKAKGIGGSSGRPSHDVTDGKLICFKEKGNINSSDKSKDVQSEHPILSPQTCTSKFSTRVDQPLHNSLSDSQKALQSTLAFAARYSSGIKMSCMAATKEKNLNEETSCSSPKMNEPLKILQFLNRQIKSCRELQTS